jgi:hypothetical protein
VGQEQHDDLEGVGQDHYEDLEGFRVGAPKWLRGR